MFFSAFFGIFRSRKQLNALQCLHIHFRRSFQFLSFSTSMTLVRCAEYEGFFSLAFCLFQCMLNVDVITHVFVRKYM